MAETALLVATNAAFLFPAAVAARLGLWPAAAVYCTVAAVSGAYHYLDATRRACLVGRHVCYAALRFLDFAYAYGMAVLTAGAWLHPAAGEGGARGLLAAAAAPAVLLAVSEDAALGVAAGVLGGGLALYALGALALGRAGVAGVRWRWAPAALACYGGAFACFCLQARAYGPVHSAWHVAVAAGMGLTLATRLPRAPRPASLLLV